MKINKSIYEGYIWYSDRPEPEIKDNQEFELEIDDCSNPFIIEGQLYDSVNELSHSIRYVNGQHICKTYHLQDLQGEKFVEDVFLSHKMQGRWLRFFQYWKEEADSLCENMGVLQPKEFVFMGFKK